MGYNCGQMATKFEKRLDRQFYFVIAMALCIWAAFVSPSQAWVSTGHEIIAQIAYDQLSEPTRGAIIAILKHHPRVNEDLLRDEIRAKDDGLAIFLRAATWPDMIRYPAHPMTHTEQHSKWHYVDIPFETDGVKGPQPEFQWDGQSDPANLVQAMQKMLADLKNHQTAADRRAIDVCWVEHLVGDAHQPLHATSWFSNEYPHGDLGGLLDIVQNDRNETVNLHYLWDSIEGLSLDPDIIRASADRIEAAHPLSKMKVRATDLSVVDWVEESFTAAKSAAYLNGSLPHAPRAVGATIPSDAPQIPAGYSRAAQATADERIALAGYRLAALLDQIAKY